MCDLMREISSPIGNTITFKRNYFLNIPVKSKQHLKFPHSSMVVSFSFWIVYSYQGPMIRGYHSHLIPQTMSFKLHNKTETYKEIFDTFCKNSDDLEIVCSDRRKVSFKSYLLYFYSQNNFEVFTKSSSIFMEDDFETITLLRDLLTSGER